MLSLPTWVIGLLLCGCLAGLFGLGASTVFYLWTRSLTTGTPLPGFGSAKASVLAPAPDAEQRAAQLDLEQAVQTGAKQLQEMATAQGMTLPWDEAMAQARVSIMELFPEA